MSSLQAWIDGNEGIVYNHTVEASSCEKDKVQSLLFSIGAGPFTPGSSPGVLLCIAFCNTGKGKLNAVHPTRLMSTCDINKETLRSHPMVHSHREEHGGH